MLRRTFVSTLARGSLLVGGGLVLVPSRGSAQNPVVERFVGSYRCELPDGGRAVIERAVDEGIAEMPGLRHRIARRRILEGDTPIPTITIARNGSGVVIDLTHGRRNASPRLGVFFTSHSATGDAIQVKHDVVGDRLRETYRDPDGGAVHWLDLSADGRRLRFSATITSPHLPGPIPYQLRFERTR